MNLFAVLAILVNTPIELTSVSMKVLFGTPICKPLVMPINITLSLGHWLH